MDYLSLFEQPPTREYKKKEEQIFCVNLEHYKQSEKAGQDTIIAIKNAYPA